MLDRTSSHGEAFFDSERELQAAPDHGRLVRRLLLAVVASAAATPSAPTGWTTGGR